MNRKAMFFVPQGGFNGMILLVRTTAASQTFIWPIQTGVGYNLLIDWGDGSSDVITDRTDPDRTHTYALAGDYEVRVSGDAPSTDFIFDGTTNAARVRELRQFGYINGASHIRFRNCVNMVVVASDILQADLSASDGYAAVFQNCDAIVDVPTLSSFVFTGGNISTFFAGSTLVNPDMSTIDFSNITNATNFMLNSNAWSTANYNAFLINVASQALNSSVPFHAGDAKYTQTSVDSGTTDGTAANKLIQSGQNFLTTVSVGDIIRNSTDNTFAEVTNVDSDTQLSLDNDIMVSGEAYVVQSSAAAKARYVLINTFSWTITDGGAI